MKKIMMIGSALFVLSSSAVFATQARLIALGMKETDNDGMYYIQDSRNIFLNVANVNNYSDMLVTEYGSAGSAIGGKGTVDKSTAPKAQGGVFKKYGLLNYGVYLGNESNTSSLLRAVSSTSAANILQTTDNQIDVFVGGEAAVKWGANVLYASGKDETVSSKDSALTTRFGLIGSNWESNLNLSLMSKSERNDSSVSQEFKGKLGLQFGGSYNVLDGKVYGYFKTFSWDQKRTTGAMVKGDLSSYYLGYGKEMAVNNGDKIFTAIAAKNTSLNLNLPTKAEIRHLVVPVTLGYEARATEWLVIRGSVIQNLYGKKDNKGLTAGTDFNSTAIALAQASYGANGKSTITNSTEVNTGATLTFDQLAIDGLIGTTATNGTDETTPGNGKKGVLSLSNLQTRVGVTYKF